jgi:nicotinate-nucleotide adenylyltransferase
MRYTSGMPEERIGIFGGTFDPPHIGHLILAGEAISQLKLTRLLWVLTPIPPHKLNQPITPVEIRLDMLNFMIMNNREFELSRVEMDRPGPHYAADTLQILGKQYPTAALIILMGGDSLRDLHSWQLAPDLVAACHEIGVMRRPGDSINLEDLDFHLPGVQSKVRFVDAPLLDIASSEIRRRVRQGKAFRYYLTPEVYEYILSKRLYFQTSSNPT